MTAQDEDIIQVNGNREREFVEHENNNVVDDNNDSVDENNDENNSGEDDYSDEEACPLCNRLVDDLPLHFSLTHSEMFM